MNDLTIKAQDIGGALDSAREEHKRLVVLYGDAGVGKSFGVKAWLKSRQGLQHTHTHDFSQCDSFGRSVRRGLGIEEAIPSAPWARGEFLAGMLQKRNGVLVLDSLHTLQAEASELGDRAFSPAVDAFIRRAERNQSGMCIVISRRRYPVVSTTGSRCILVTPPDAAFLSEFMQASGVVGTRNHLASIAACLGNNPALVNITSRLLVSFFDGDALSAMQSFELDLESSPVDNAQTLVRKCIDLIEPGQRELLFLLGVMPGPISLARLDHLRREPIIAGLTGYVSGGTDEEWKHLGSALAHLGLVRVFDHDEEGRILEIEPVAAETIRQIAFERTGNSVLQVNERLFFALQNSAKVSGKLTKRSLYDAVKFGCLAGRRQEAFTDVYLGQLAKGVTYFQAGQIVDEWSTMRMLLSAPLHEDCDPLDNRSTGIAEHTIGYCHRAIGQCRNASDWISRGLQRFCEEQSWGDAQRAANHLAISYWYQGRLADALCSAIASIRFVALCEGKSSSKNTKRNRTTVGSVLRYAGEFELAKEAFLIAQENSSTLTGIPASRYIELLIATGRIPDAHRLLASLSPDKPNKHPDLAEFQLAIQKTFVDFVALPRSERKYLPKTIDKQIGKIREIGLQEGVVWALLMKAKMYRMLRDPVVDLAEEALCEAEIMFASDQMTKLQIDILAERCWLAKFRSDLPQLAFLLHKLEDQVDQTAQVYEPQQSALAPWIVGQMSELVAPGKVLKYDYHRGSVLKFRELLEEPG